MRATAAAQMLIGHPVSVDAVAAAAARASTEISPTGNVHCTAEYQSHLAAVLSRRALASAGARAAQGIRT